MRYRTGGGTLLIVHSDASVKAHHGVGIGWHIQTWADDQDSLLKTVTMGRDFLSDQYTSEEAEILALIRGVKEAISMDERTYLRLGTDCHPLVSKVQNRKNVRDGEYMDSLYRLLDKVDEWAIQWISRDKNSDADSQASKALDQQT